MQINVPQTYAMQTPRCVGDGQPARVQLAADSQREITRIAESVEATSRTMLAEIELDNVAYRFQPGSYAQVTLAAPKQCRVDDSDQHALNAGRWSACCRGQRAESSRDQATSTLGRDLGDRVVAADGIHGGERLIVNPGDDLVSGVSVQINGRSESPQKVAQAEEVSRKGAERKEAACNKRT